jgi:hypothetical protein
VPASIVPVITDIIINNIPPTIIAAGGLSAINWNIASVSIVFPQVSDYSPTNLALCLGDIPLNFREAMLNVVESIIRQKPMRQNPMIMSTKILPSLCIAA